MESNNIIDVAVPLPLEGVYSYSTPDHLRDRVLIGRRVIVPFGKKVRAGIIVSEHSTPAADIQLKPIIDIPDEPPVFDPLFWDFLKWISNYYLVPIGLALKTALPPGSAKKSATWVVITEQGKGWLDDLGDKVPAKLRKKKGAMLEKELVVAIGQRSVTQAVKNGWITREQRVSRSRISKRALSFEGEGVAGEIQPGPKLTAHQSVAADEIISAVESGGFHPFLLYGVTGSGKTEVYLQAIEATLKAGKRALTLVPEIALTPQLADRFRSRLGPGVGIFHSGFTNAQRIYGRSRVMSGDIKVVIAARSGIFLPMQDLGLIIVDEEHDTSYKQADGCPYNARDMALIRAKMQEATVILGSATPSFETYMNAKKGKFRKLDLPIRTHGGGLPKVELIDLKQHKLAKTSLLTGPTLQAIEETLKRKEQVLIFLNRRGFDTFVLCRSCGHVFKCPNCDISLTHHKSAKDLRCHFCGYSQESPPLCPICGSEKIFFGGIGVQKIEEDLATLFPEAVIERLDRDSTHRREDLEDILDRFRDKKIDILTGTQMLVKGHDFPGISLVVALCGDASLHFPDFRSGERTFQMLTQVAGRTGRGADTGKVIVQTFDPEHEAIQCASTHDYETFFDYDSRLRSELLYPPYGHLILIRIDGVNEKRVESKAVKIAAAARGIAGDSRRVFILGPAPAPRKKLVGKHRWQVLLKGADRRDVRSLVAELEAAGHLKSRGVRISIDVDPMDLM